jgi:hypothetical protein
VVGCALQLRGRASEGGAGRVKEKGKPGRGEEGGGGKGDVS